MRTKIYSVTAIGISLLFLGVFHERFFADRELTGTAETPRVSGQNEIRYDAKVKNPLSTPIRLCGGQMNWCGANGCYKVATQFPVTLEPGQEATITVMISPQGETLSETELILYADGKGLDGLTPVKIKLPAMSRKSQ